METKGATRSETRRKWAVLIEEQRRSGLSQRAFCEQEGLSLNRFYYWLRRLRETSDTVSFVPVPLGPAVPQSSLTLVWSSCRVEIGSGFDPETLRSLLRVLRTS